jgi:plasmid stabilization system protein ParE
MGRVVPEINNDSIRELLVYSYRLVYQISQDNEIQVLTLFHSKRRFPTTMK